MNDERRRGPRGEGWGQSRRGRGEWGAAAGGPTGSGGPGYGGPGFGPGFGPGRGRGSRGAGRGWGSPGQWGWPEGSPTQESPEFGPVFGHVREFHRHGPGGHRRARRGDVRAAILDLLAEGRSWNGYQIIQEIAERTSGVWRPSAGSVYPALQQLEDEGLIIPEGEGRRRLYTLTDEGRAYVEEHADELRDSWGAVAGRTDDASIELGVLFRQVALAAMEVRRAGTPGQLAAARQVLAEARRALYLILADEAPTAAAGEHGEHGEHGDAEDGLEDVDDRDHPDDDDLDAERGVE